VVQFFLLGSAGIARKIDENALGPRVVRRG